MLVSSQEATFDSAAVPSEKEPELGWAAGAIAAIPLRVVLTPN
jgi:hypothetical protein